nr:aminotransferase class IV [Halorussus halophilus]
MYYHVDGDVVPADEATVSVRDRGFMYGDAAFETMRAYGGEIFEWDAHAERLRKTCETLSIDHGLTKEDLRERIDATLDANDFEDAYVKLSISRGVQPGKLTPQPVEDATVVVYVSELPRGGKGSDPVWDDPARAEIVETRRVPDAALPASAKTHNYLNGILAKLELAQDTDTAIMLDSHGNLAEAATSNLFFVADRTIKTPGLDGPILPGITRQVVFELAGGLGLSVEEGTYSPDELRDADEAFLTNSTWELRPIGSVDGRELGRGPVIEALAGAFDARVECDCYE